MASPAQARGLPGAAPRGHRAALQQPAERREAPGHLRLRWLRPAAVLVRDEIRKRHRLAELLQAAGECGRDVDRPLAADGAHRGALPPLRRSPGPCVRGWAEADRPALLHERRLAHVSSGGWPRTRLIVPPTVWGPANFAGTRRILPGIRPG